MVEPIAFEVRTHHTWATVETQQGRVPKEGKFCTPRVPSVFCGNSAQAAEAWRWRPSATGIGW